jgi:hypothetical protein
MALDGRDHMYEGCLIMYKIYDGDLFLFAVDTKFEADEQAEAGFQVVKSA